MTSEFSDQSSLMNYNLPFSFLIKMQVTALYDDPVHSILAESSICIRTPGSGRRKCKPFSVSKLSFCVTSCIMIRYFQNVVLLKAHHTPNCYP